MERELTAEEIIGKLYERYRKLAYYSITGYTVTTRRKWVGLDFIESQPFCLTFEAPESLRLTWKETRPKRYEVSSGVVFDRQTMNFTDQSPVSRGEFGRHWMYGYPFGVAELMQVLCLQNVKEIHDPKRVAFGRLYRERCIPKIREVARLNDELVNDEMCYQLQFIIGNKGKTIWISQSELLVRKLKDQGIDQEARTYAATPAWLGWLILVFALIYDEICSLLKRNDQRMLGGCLMLDTEHTFVESKFTLREPVLEG